MAAPPLHHLRQGSNEPQHVIPGHHLLGVDAPRDDHTVSDQVSDGTGKPVILCGCLRPQGYQKLLNRYCGQTSKGHCLLATCILLKATVFLNVCSKEKEGICPFLKFN